MSLLLTAESAAIFTASKITMAREADIRVAVKIELPEADRQKLERWATSRSVVVRPRDRSRIVLRASEGRGLTTEPENVGAFEALGIERRLLPVKGYRGAAGTNRRYFPVKLRLRWRPGAPRSSTPIPATRPPPRSGVGRCAPAPLGSAYERGWSMEVIAIVHTLKTPCELGLGGPSPQPPQANR